MIWYFIAGYIAGMIGTLAVAKWLGDSGRLKHYDERSRRDQDNLD